jgi:hypothetical protein
MPASPEADNQPREPKKEAADKVVISGNRHIRGGATCANQCRSHVSEQSRIPHNFGNGDVRIDFNRAKITIRK